MIQQAQREDLGDLLPLLRQLFQIEEDFSFDPKKQQKGLAMLLESSCSVIMVAKEQQRVVGMATGQLVISTAEGGPSLLVEDLVVDPSCRKRGIGRRLLKALGNWGKGRGARRLQLLADKNNADALQFYRRTGWQKTRLICLRSYQRDREET